jgi:two-component system response regulator MprA
VCEDDPRIRAVVRESLALAGHRVRLTHRGAEAVRAFGADSGVEVLVLDIVLPDGRDVCQALRAAGQQAPVLFLTARDGLGDVISGFGAGGDDYLTKPFAVDELQVRVAALARRGRPPAPASGLVLDPAAYAVRWGGAQVRLTPTEFRMLAALAGRPGEIVRRHELLAAGWPRGAQVTENTLDSFVRWLGSDPTSGWRRSAASGTC